MPHGKNESSNEKHIQLARKPKENDPHYKYIGGTHFYAVESNLKNLDERRPTFTSPKPGK